MSGLFGRLLGRVHTRHAIVIDAASDDTIRSLLFDIGKKDQSILEKRFLKLPMRSADQNFTGISRGIRMHLGAFMRQISGTPSALVIGLGNRFTRAELVEWKREHENPIPMRPEELRGLMDEFRAANQEKKIDGIRRVLADAVPVGIRVDGYAISTVGKKTKGRIFETGILATYADPLLAKVLVDIQHEYAGIPFRTFPTQLAVAGLIEHIEKVPDALLIRVGGLGTEISIMRRGHISFTGWFSKGGDMVTDAIAHAAEVSLDEAERIKCLAGTTILSPELKTKVSQAIGSSAKEWLAELKKTLEASDVMEIPPKCFMAGGGSRLMELRQILQAEPWYASFGKTAPPAIHVLDAGVVAENIFRNIHPILSGPDEIGLLGLAHELIRQIRAR